MENKEDKYKGFANAAEYVQDIQARFTAFETENAAYLAYLKQKEDSGDLEDNTNDDPQEVVQPSALFYQKNHAFRIEMNEGITLLYADKIEAAQNMITQMTQWIDKIKAHIAEYGSTADVDDRLEKLETAVMYLKQDMSLSQLQINALQKEIQN